MTAAITSDLLRTTPLPAPGEDKDQRGRVLVAGGNRAVPGAILLAAEAALRAGAGKLQIAAGGSLALGLGLRLPEALVMALPETEDGDFSLDAAEALAKAAQRTDALLLGPGMMDRDAAMALVEAALARTPAAPC